MGFSARTSRRCAYAGYVRQYSFPAFPCAFAQRFLPSDTSHTHYHIHVPPYPHTHHYLFPHRAPHTHTPVAATPLFTFPHLPHHLPTHTDGWFARILLRLHTHFTDVTLLFTLPHHHHTHTRCTTHTHHTFLRLPPHCTFHAHRCHYNAAGSHTTFCSPHYRTLPAHTPHTPPFLFTFSRLRTGLDGTTFPAHYFIPTPLHSLLPHLPHTYLPRALHLTATHTRWFWYFT